MKKVVVAGGAGFIGSHLCDYLINKGFYVICIDNLLTGSMKNTSHLLGNKNFKFINADVLDFSTYHQLSADYIFHLASPASPVDYQNYPEETALANTFGTLNMLKLAVKNKAKFLFVSTSEIYGDPKEHPQKESYWGNVNTLGPRSCYDEGKRFGETLTYIFVKKYKLDARVIRIFNTYGPRMQKDDGRVVSNFINQALEGKPLTIYGKGDQTRSFCFITDLIDGISKAMFSKGTEGKVFNLGNPEEYSILDLAKKIKKLTASDSPIVFKKLPKDDPVKRKPDISMAKKALTWEPKVSLHEGLVKTIGYYNNI